MNEFVYGAVIFAILVVLLGVSSYLDHTEKMECMKQHGTYANKSCAFPQQAKPQ